MKLMRATPTPAAVRRDVDTLFDRMFRSPLFPDFPPAKFMPEVNWEPALDFSETEKEYLVRLEAPGFHRENLDVKLDGNLLTLTGHRELEKEMKEEEYLWHEREEGRFTRTLRLPTAVDEAKIEAVYENGILRVKLPKLTPVPKAKIAIK